MLLGWISDKFGRRKPLYFTVCLAAVFGFAGAFSPLFWLFVSARFVVGFMLGMSRMITNNGAFPTSFPRLSHTHPAREREPWKRSFGFLLLQYEYSTVQILQSVNLLPWSCTGDYTVDQCSETTLVDLFACSMGKFNNLAIFIQGTYLYGRLDFANSIFFVSVVFGQRQT